MIPYELNRFAEDSKEEFDFVITLMLLLTYWPDTVRVNTHICPRKFTSLVPIVTGKKGPVEIS